MGKAEATPESGDKPIMVKFEGRNTKMGAYTKYRIFSLRQDKEIEPHRTEESRTRRHWTDYWYLLSGEYFLSVENISNSGKHYCTYGLLVVEEDQYHVEKWKAVLPEYASVCECIEGELNTTGAGW